MIDKDKEYRVVRTKSCGYRHNSIHIKDLTYEEAITMQNLIKNAIKIRQEFMSEDELISVNACSPKVRLCDIFKESNAHSEFEQTIDKLAD